MEVNVCQQVKQFSSSPNFIRQVAFFVLRRYNKGKGELSIHLVGDKKIRQLNKNYRKNDQITDVISFAFGEGKKIGQSEDIGDIFISLPQVCRQAKEFGIMVEEELARMLIHGLLHLLGYDHQTIVEEKRMIKLQEKILKDLPSL